MAVGKNGLVTALDVGSTKVCCFIARPDGSGFADLVSFSAFAFSTNLANSECTLSELIICP